MTRLINLIFKTGLFVAALGVAGYAIQRRQLDEKVLMGFEKYFRAIIGQEPLS